MENCLCGPISEVKKVSFYRNNSEISPYEMFSGIYAPLNEVIEFNRDYMLNSKKRALSLYSCDSPLPSFEGIEEIREELNKRSSPYLAKIGTEDGKSISCKVEPRTNFDDSLLKSPNILYLSYRGDSPMVLRGALDRDDERVFERKARKFFGQKYKGKFDPSSKMGYSDVYFVPESRLLLGLEGIYSRGISERITPEIKIVDSKDNDFWYLRKFIPSLRDSSVTEEQVGKYSGIFNGLGLIDAIDNQKEHYCVRDGRVIHIDPDYITYSANPNFGNQTDLNALKETLPSFFSGLKGIRFKKNRIDEIRKVSEKLGNQKFHDYIPTNIQDSPFLDQLRVSS